MAKDASMSAWNRKRCSDMGKWIRRTIIAFVILFIFMIAWQWRQLSKKQEYRQEALLYFREEDYSKSIRYLKRGLRKHTLFSGKLDDDMRCYLAESYFRLEEYDKAAVIYDDLIGSQDNNALYYRLKGESCARQKKYEEAVKTYKKGFEKTGDTGFLLEQTQINIIRGDYEQALECVEQGIKADRKNKADFLFEKIALYEKELDYQKAYEAAREYTELYPDDERGRREYIFLSTRI